VNDKNQLLINLSEPYSAVQTSRRRGSLSHDVQLPCHVQRTSRESSGADAGVPGGCHASGVRWYLERRGSVAACIVGDADLFTTEDVLRSFSKQG
jgi:hypothetical protein